MSKSKLNYRIYSGKSFKVVFENSRMIFMTVIFAVGIIIGASLLNNKSEITETAGEYLNSNLLNKTGQGISDIFFNSFVSNGIFMAVNVFLAFSLIGYPLLIWVPFLKGLGTGIVYGYIYLLYGLTGLGYNVLILLPGAMVSSFALISACNISCEYSANAYSKAITGKGQFERGETKYYLIKQIILIVICAISSLIDALFSFAFLRFFEF